MSEEDNSTESAYQNPFLQVKNALIADAVQQAKIAIEICVEKYNQVNENQITYSYWVDNGWGVPSIGGAESADPEIFVDNGWGVIGGGLPAGMSSATLMCTTCMSVDFSDDSSIGELKRIPLEDIEDVLSNYQMT